MKQAFTIGGLIRRNLRYYWRTNLAVALGCAIAVAALVGSLLVGDSVRGSLHDLAIERLGRVEYAVESPSFFREQLAADLLAQPQAKGAADFAVPAILATGAAKPADGGAVVNRVNVIGVPPEFSDIAIETFRAAAGPPDRRQFHARRGPRNFRGRRDPADRRTGAGRSGGLHLHASKPRPDDAHAQARRRADHSVARHRRIQPAAGIVAAEEPLRCPRLAPGAVEAAGPGEHDPHRPPDDSSRG